MIYITMIKLISGTLLEHITLIVNTSIRISILSRAWESACRIPLPKNSNYIHFCYH